MKVSENVVHQIAHFSTVGFLVYTATLYFTPLHWAIAVAVISSAVKEFVFDRRTQDLQGRLEDFVFLCAGGVSAAFLLVLRMHIAMSGS